MLGGRSFPFWQVARSLFPADRFRVPCEGILQFHSVVAPFTRLAFHGSTLWPLPHARSPAGRFVPPLWHLEKFKFEYSPLSHATPPAYSTTCPCPLSLRSKFRSWDFRRSERGALPPRGRDRVRLGAQPRPRPPARPPARGHGDSLHSRRPSARSLRPSVRSAAGRVCAYFPRFVWLLRLVGRSLLELKVSARFNL